MALVAYRALADTLTQALGRPASVDSTMLRWERSDHDHRMGPQPAHLDSIEILARSSSLPAPRGILAPIPEVPVVA
jgi:hypothetical protein